ncbi:rho guanine nucleotide exchange factor 18a isoform X1 [Girardinichthys multiradiatus]|uniref:rho guanine nucleotide exchange factor 18a isoform X1 n=1 Tax=Girardinichthys multiradiatus TaxID=208333 RepID=UPI001FAE38DC|nr:rho guanine nucleotide exchange factor 18a isoform X1 [Girardinichthys multiradiatus]XP_047225263.1 rho guanine nucleotide exchange factor 18a isoform X1 [Girardinichthys multiradiatus]XP_047225264.1 rho guanine nucleotide exchange factor 18a isoform X1 [Girardinichthys multiradiatus]XP_047225265.1 rho guanine nucleotide exchange factor 18a isoform X1 [Girardinichthys multiradiatus]XP_047225266.1 rho guanine nucleotide exchange factor 18a isoform X1 [Girardinichthys multiradiatus]XP_0472252
MDELDGQRVKLFTDDPGLLAPSLAEAINLEDCHYAQLQADLEWDAHNLEAESWSLAVDQNYLMSMNKEAGKRQDVIYELIQTEMHHVRTLKILFHIYMYELKQSLLVDDAWLEKLFPGVEVLLSLHMHFFNFLKLRQKQSQDEENPNNFCITQLGDILINQFSGNLGEQMMVVYSHFCSHHSEAVNFYKEQTQNNKKLQILIRKIDQLPLVRRLTIPECFLLVTQRITKYPILLERIIQNTDADTDECKHLENALELIKHTISQVNTQVSEYDKIARIREISYRLEPKTPIRLMDDQWFRREDLIQGNKTLLYEGALTWRSSGKQKAIQAVLLSDMLLLLQEKDQKLVLAAMDNKPPVIFLQRVIVREVAHEEKGMYIICASTSGLAGMYELHTGSKDECQTWINLIREAVDCYRDNEMHSEMMAKLQCFQDLLQQKDNQIKQSLEEKQHVFATLYNHVVGREAPSRGLLLRGDSSDLQQGEALLSGAIEELEKLQNLLFLRIKHLDVPVEEETEIQQSVIRRAETFKGTSDYPVANSMKYEDAAEKAEGRSSNCDHLLKNLSISEDLEKSADDESETHQQLHCSSTSSIFPKTAVFDSVEMLTQTLYSLKALIAQQDSRIELQRVFQSKSKLPVRSNSSVLLEQEKHRNLEKQREELAKLHKQQVQHQAEQQRWEKEKEKQRMLIEGQEAELQQRQEECRKMEAALKEENLELKMLRETYQEDLERLRETTRKLDREKEQVNREKERLEKIKSKLIPNYDDPTRSSTLSAFPSFRSTTVNGGGTLTQPSNPLVFTGNFPDPADTPPLVPPRRESISPRPNKQRLPVQLISTTNEVQKPAEVQQKIPRKLAAEAKGKGKTLKAKHSHKRAHSAGQKPANIDVSQVVPIRVTGKDGGSLKTQTNTGQSRVLNSDTFRPPGSGQNMKPSQSFIAPKWNTMELPPPPAPPPFPKDILSQEQEKIIVI